MGKTKENKARVADVMCRDVETLDRNDQLSIANDLMQQHRIRHLPILDDDGDVAGVVSQRDLFRGALVRALGYGSGQQQKMMEMLLVKEVMATEVVTTTPDEELQAAARVMLDRKIGCLPVLEDGKLVGILTESDFVALAANAEKT